MRHGLAVSQPDPFRLDQLPAYLNIGPVDAGGRVPVRPDSLTGDIVTIISSGQSNAANSIIPDSYTIRHASNIYNLNIWDGALYQINSTRLIGCSLMGGNGLVQLADLLLDNGYFDNAVLVPIAIGATTIEQHATGFLAHRAGAAAARVAALGLTPDIIDMHLGESDSLAHTSSGAMEAGCLAYRALWDAAGVDAPILLHQASFINGAIPAGGPAVKAGVAACWTEDGFLQGYDTDNIGAPFRFDGTHLSTSGQALFAAQRNQLMRAYFDSL